MIWSQTDASMVVISDHNPVDRYCLFECLSPHFSCVVAPDLSTTFSLLASIARASSKRVLLLIEIEQLWQQQNGDQVDGIEFIRAIRHHPGIAHCLRAVICITERQALRDKALTLSAGANEYYTKPISPAMVSRIDIFLRNALP